MKKNELLEKFVNQFNSIIAPGAESLNKEMRRAQETPPPNGSVPGTCTCTVRRSL